MAVSGSLIAAVSVPANAGPTKAVATVVVPDELKYPMGVEPSAALAAAPADMQAGVPPMPKAEVARGFKRPAPEPAPPEAAEGSSSTPAPASASSTDSAPADQPSGNTASAIDVAKKYIGTPYVFGGTTSAGFDCSGFTSQVFRELGVTLPRTARAQQAMATRVSDPKPGDLVFRNFPATHVGIYVGPGMMIDSNRPGTTVSIHKMWGGNFSYGRVG